MDLSLQWLAGFFDGEGYVGFSWTTKTKKGVKYSYPRVTIANTHLPVLKLIQNEFGGSLKQLPRNINTVKTCYSLAWSCRKAQRFLEAIAPYVIVKKDQVDLILKAWYVVKKGQHITPSELVRRAEIATQITDMKHVNYTQ